MKIDVLHELEGFGITHEITDGYAKVLCPFHADTNPSANVSLEHGGFKCFSCGATAEFAGYLAASLKKSPQLIRKELEVRYGATKDKTIPIEVQERCYNQLKEESYLKAELAKRCISDDIIRHRRLGAEKGRIVIPIHNDVGYLVNLRKHRPGGEYGNKVINQRGHGKPPRLYPIDQLKYEKIAVCGGELKALAAGPILNQMGIGAISPTCGEKTWHIGFTEALRNKTVYIIYDVDEAGEKGAESVAKKIYPVVNEVYIIKLPLDTDVYPTGDVNDFLADNGDLKMLIASHEIEDPWVPPYKKHTLNGSTKEVPIVAAFNAENTSRRLKTECVIAAIGQQPYTIPSKVVVECPKDQDICSACAVRFDPEGEEYELHPEDIAVLGMVEVTEATRNDSLKKSIGIPPQCRLCTFTPTDNYHVEAVRLSPKLELTNRESQRELLPAYVLKEDLLLNEVYNLEGRLYPHPQSQASTLLISEAEVSEDALTLYKNENPHELSLFKPREWTPEGIQRKLDDLYGDMEANVTRIFGRRKMHLIVDLVYHSPLFIDAFKKPNQRSRKKGWVEALIIGDSAQGKTEVATSLMDHYRLGEKVDCKNATVAGLIGGLQQMGKRWFVTWGLLPKHDKRVLILEELKGMNSEVFSKLTDVRSSGKAQIPKIQQHVTTARTRILALTNPTGGRTMDTWSRGVEAIKQLIPAPEDIRRFDIALIVSSDEVTQQEINLALTKSLDVDHNYTSQLCQRLVLWAWTVDKIKFEDEKHILDCSVKLQEKYSDHIPLINAGSAHEKIARLSAALAARTYSTNDKYDELIVRNCHVDFIVNFLQEIYDAPNFKYNDYSAANSSDEYIDEEEVQRLINKSPNPRLLAEFLCGSQTVDAVDISNWTGYDHMLSGSYISELVRGRVLQRSSVSKLAGPRYYLTPAAIRTIESMKANRKFIEPPDEEEVF